MKLSVEEVESYIGQISCGGKLTVIENSAGEKILLFLRHPTLKDTVMADFIKTKSLERAKADGLPSIEEMEALIVRRSIWSPSKDAEVKLLEKQKEAQKVLLSKTTRIRANRDRIKDIIKDIDKKIWENKREKELYLLHTRERRSEEERLLYLTWSGTYDYEIKDRYWDTLDEFRREQDNVFRNRVAMEYSIFSIGMSNELIRYIARQPQWRMRYMASQKSNARLFNSDVCDYSVDMLSIVYWSSFYASLYEMMPEDRPAEDVIEDDSALDSYMEAYFKEQSNRDADARSNKKISKLSALNHEEVIVTSSNPLYSEIDYSETIAEKLRKRGDSRTEVRLEDKRH